MEQPKTSFYDLLKESVLAQSLLALVCMVGTFALLLAERPVPDYVWLLDASVISFFFGAKTLFNQRQLTSENARLLSQIAQQLAGQLAGQNGQVLQAMAANSAAGKNEGAQGVSASGE